MADKNLVKTLIESDAKHSIAVYGVDDENAENYLNKTLSEEDRFEVTKSSRLWLHANYLEFTYKDIIYKTFSKNRDLYSEFIN